MSREKIFNRVDQVGLVVKDLQKSMEHYWNDFGIGPWDIFTFEAPLIQDMTIRGKPADYRMKLALTRLGKLTIELIQPLEGNTTYKEFLEEKGEGIHHLGVFVEDMDEGIARLKEQGIEVIQSGRFPDGGYAYMDTEERLGAIFELIQLSSWGENMTPQEKYPPDA
jgi:4-hydroxyphenylpyruvate dioxygenase-like putative hemolysin